MEEHIENIRQKELALIRKSAMVRNVIDSFNTSSPFLVSDFLMLRKNAVFENFV